jgi:adenine C2-methylase RlmN of 23S rRNA A2503 and tRNA A37
MKINCNTAVSLSALNLNLREKLLSVTNAYLLHCHGINTTYSGITL